MRREEINRYARKWHAKQRGWEKNQNGEYVKKCDGCEAEYPVSSRSKRCEQCRAKSETAANAEYYRRNKDKLRPSRQEWERQHRRERKEYYRMWRARNSERANAYALKSYYKRRDKMPVKREAQKLREYGLTIEAYQSLLAGQAHKCAICRGDEPTGRKLAVDHDHINMAIRGLLCTNCNQGIGKFKDNPSLLEAAAEYLRASHMANGGIGVPGEQIKKEVRT